MVHGRGGGACRGNRVVKLSRIGQIAINVRDVKRSIEFYRDTLGMEFLFEVPRMGFFNCDGIRLMLSQADESESSCASPVIYYGVDDIQQSFELLTESGVTFTSAPRHVATVGAVELWMAFFRDPDDNVVGLICEMAKP
jgi:catechol 2,3-dioxygenase-like lactoylglutathione lyase family enzyme